MIVDFLWGCWRLTEVVWFRNISLSMKFIIYLSYTRMNEWKERFNWENHINPINLMHANATKFFFAYVRLKLFFFCFEKMKNSSHNFNFVRVLASVIYFCECALWIMTVVLYVLVTHFCGEQLDDFTRWHTHTRKMKRNVKKWHNIS